MDCCSYNIATINIANISNETKINALKTFIRSAELDIIFLQEVQNERLILPGFKTLFNIDVHQRGTAIAVRDLWKIGNVEKSLDSRIISVKINTTTFINVYAPSGAERRSEREEFFNISVANFLHHATGQIVLGGDFNAVVHNKDATGSGNISPMCKRLMNAAELLDSWEILNGNRVEFSFIRANAASRLDRILISRSLQQDLRSAHFTVTSFTDHKAYVIRLVLQNLGSVAGRGIWRFQKHVFDDPAVLNEFAAKWTYWIRTKRNYSSWIEWWQSFAKLKVVSFLKWQTSLIHRDFRATLELHRSILKEAYNNYLGHPEQLLIINRVKAQMLRHQRNFSESFRRINETFIAGESTSLFHVEQLNNRRTNISTIETEDETIIDDPGQIRETIRTFFEQLYDTHEVDGDDDFFPARSIPAGQPQNENLMEPIVADDIFAAIKTSSSRKSPGADGLPKEFYAKTWRIIQNEFTLILNDALRGAASKDFYDGVIVLVRKKGNDKTVKGYRPISLLNYDYKLLARILKQRMNGILPLILSDHQKCSNGDRSIFEATGRILDEVSRLRSSRNNALLVSFDLDHAFDRVSHQFLNRTLTRMNFNPRFVELLEKIWSQSFSKILINGQLTREFKICRSVRQGDPLAMHIFVVYLQPLLDKLSSTLPTAVMNAYADDISMFIDEERNLIRVAEVFSSFGAASGALLNRRKTTATMIGNVNLTCDSEWLNIENFIDILGITFGENINQACKLNWERVLRGIRVRLWFHNPRALNLIQKVILLNTYICSKLWYMASNITISKGFIKKIKSELGKFLWHGQPLQRISFTNLTLPKERGGLNLHCPDLKSKSLLTNRLLSLIQHLPFLRNLLENTNVAAPSMCNHVTLLRNELRSIPENLLETLSSSGLYNHYISLLPEPGFVAAETREWKTIFKNIHSSFLSAKQRSAWIAVIHKKVRHRELFFLRNVTEDPYCHSCPNVTDTVVHKLFECQRIRNIWEYENRKLILHNHLISNLAPEDFIYPDLRIYRRTTRQFILKQLATYFSYFVEIAEVNQNVESYIVYSM